LCQVLVEDRAKDQVEDRVKDQVEDQAAALAVGQVKDLVKDLVGDQVGDRAEDQAGDQAEDRAEDLVEDQAVVLARDQHHRHKVLPLGRHKPQPTSNLRHLCRGSIHRHTSCNHLCLVRYSQFTMTQTYTFLLKPNL